jgi:hypothetical protein
MRTNLIFLLCLIAILIIPLNGCNLNNKEKEMSLLTTDDFVNFSLSAPEGSGGVRTLKINYMSQGETKSDTMDAISSVDIEGYDDEKKEQSFTVSDYNHDGIIDFIVYREFWFPDLDMVHPDVPKWPTIYEYDLEKGFVIASSDFRSYYEEYVKSVNVQLTSNKEPIDDIAVLALKRLMFAAEKVADGSFVPKSPYNGQYYEDVYELVKEITK